MKTNPNIRELLTETSPYFICESEGKTTLKYQPEISNPEAHKTLLPIVNQNLAESFYVMPNSNSPDSLKIVIDTSFWMYCGNKAHFGIYRIDNHDDQTDGLEFTISEFEYNDLLDDETRKRVNIYTEVYTTHDAQNMSQQDRIKLDEVGGNKTEFTYGECVY